MVGTNWVVWRVCCWELSREEFLEKLCCPVCEGLTLCDVCYQSVCTQSSAKSDTPEDATDVQETLFWVSWRWYHSTLQHCGMKTVNNEPRCCPYSIRLTEFVRFNVRGGWACGLWKWPLLVSGGRTSPFHARLGAKSSEAAGDGRIQASHCAVISCVS